MCSPWRLARVMTMKQLEQPTPITLWQVNLLRVGYLVMGGGLAVYKWPLLVDHEPWSLAEGTVECLLVGMSLLALLGLRYPVRMLPILLFEVTWKVLWLGVVVLPSWLDGPLDAATREQVGKVLWVAIVVAVIPWRHVVKSWAMAPGDPWRRASLAEADAAVRTSASAPRARATP
jgi:hypothetical protein